MLFCRLCRLSFSARLFILIICTTFCRRQTSYTCHATPRVCVPCRQYMVWHVTRTHTHTNFSTNSILSTPGIRTETNRQRLLSFASTDFLHSTFAGKLSAKCRNWIKFTYFAWLQRVDGTMYALYHLIKYLNKVYGVFGMITIDNVCLRRALSPHRLACEKPNFPSSNALIAPPVTNCITCDAAYTLHTPQLFNTSDICINLAYKNFRRNSKYSFTKIAANYKRQRKGGWVDRCILSSRIPTTTITTCQ